MTDIRFPFPLSSACPSVVPYISTTQRVRQALELVPTSTLSFRYAVVRLCRCRSCLCSLQGMP
jgi:hypothetical protein